MRTRKYQMFIGVVLAIALIMGCKFGQQAYEVKNQYRNSDSYSDLDVNAYVGGDAYNYIINGTYFIGYMVGAIGMFIIISICLISIIHLQIGGEVKVKKEEEELPTL